MEDLRVNSWLELQDVLHRDAWNPVLRRFRSPYVFRGQGHAAPLTTSLQRLAGPTRVIERHLVRAFRKYAHASAHTGDLLWSWLALGQHHGLPTRLLDWSYSPLVAVHFATAAEEDYGQDGVIWMLDVSATNAVLPASLREMLELEGSSVLSTDILAPFSAEQRRQGRFFDAEIDWLERFEAEAGEPFLLFLEPPSLDQRIVQQSALFSLLSNPEAELEPWLAGHGGAAHSPAGQVEMGGARQARRLERHRADALSGPERPEPVAAALLLAACPAGESHRRRLVRIPAPGRRPAQRAVIRTNPASGPAHVTG